MRAYTPPLDERERQLRARIAGLVYAVSVTARSIERAREKHARVIRDLDVARSEFNASRARNRPDNATKGAPVTKRPPQSISPRPKGSNDGYKSASSVAG